MSAVRTYTNEAAKQEALAGGPLPPRPSCCRPGCCAPGTPEQVAAVRAERDAAHARRERGQVVTDLGQYLYDQVQQRPADAEWVAGLLIAHLIRVAKSDDMPGAVRVLIDATGDVEALVTLTPAGPPNPPVPSPSLQGTPPAAGRGRRWWGNVVTLVKLYGYRW